MHAVASIAGANNDWFQLLVHGMLADYLVAMHAGRYFFLVAEKTRVGQADDQVYALIVTCVRIVLCIINFTQANNAIINQHGQRNGISVWTGMDAVLDLQ